MTTTITKETVLEALGKVQAPGAGTDIVREGWVKQLEVGPDRVSFRLEVPGPLTPSRQGLGEACRAALRPLLGAKEPALEVISRIPASYVAEGKQALAPGVKNFIAVGSGKGGVGKSTVAANLAAGLARAGARTGLLDVDVFGPSVPLLFGVTREAFMEEMTLHAQEQAMSHRHSEDAATGRGHTHDHGVHGGHDHSHSHEEQPKLIPYDRHGVRTMSIGYLIEEDRAAIWRGPMVHGAIQQLLRDTDWGELDYLVLDLPPGTGDAQLTISQSIPLAGAVIVCSPQPVALADAKKALNMFKTTKTEVLGLVENMAGDVFGKGGAEDAATEWGIPFLGSLELDPAVRKSGDRGIPLLADEEATGPIVDALWDAVDRLTVVLARHAKARPRALPIRRT